ncbi:MAG: hypothetical protein GX262_10355 [Clostridia bacterium]|nr:hypothetical protein [Clostridia bacterium]
MMDTSISIFNDVLAPVTPGPSSSNTAGTCRIAKVARQIFGAKPQRALIEMSTMGGFPTNFYGMKSDLAFIVGLMGKNATEYPLERAYEDANREGIEVEYKFTDELPGTPFELARLTLADENGRQMVIMAASTGGGSFVISEIDGCPVEIRGKHHELLVFLERSSSPEMEDLKDEIVAIIPTVNQAVCCEGRKYNLINIKSWQSFRPEQLTRIRGMKFVQATAYVKPEYMIIYNINRKPVFSNYREMLDYVNKQKISLWQAAIDYEISISGWTEDEVWAYAEKLLDISLFSMEKGMEEGFTFQGITKPMAHRLAGDLLTKPLLPMGMLSYGVPAALAVMEYGNAHGNIVCMPTGGSAGIIPGAIHAAGKTMGVSKSEKVKALLVAGLIGTFMFETNYSGEIGCQAEIGCATAMAAAALTHFMSPDAETCCNSASLAIQSLLGLICDPVAGLVQVPCLIRNMTGVAIALVVANASVCGFQARIPLDEMVDAILKVGEKIRMAESCGAYGTPTGCRLAGEYQKMSIRKTDL